MHVKDPSVIEPRREQAEYACALAKWLNRKKLPTQAHTHWDLGIVRLNTLFHLRRSYGVCAPLLHSQAGKQAVLCALRWERRLQELMG